MMFRVFMFMALLFTTTSQAISTQLTCTQIWDNDDGNILWSELLPAPLEDELVAPSSEAVILQQSQEGRNASALEKFGDLLSKHYIVPPETQRQISIQDRLWALFQTLYGFDVDRDPQGEWVFKFYPIRPVEVVAQQFGFSLPQVEALIFYFHTVRIRRFRAHPNYLEAYRQIVDRNPVFGRVLADYELHLRNQEALDALLVDRPSRRQ